MRICVLGKGRERESWRKRKKRQKPLQVRCLIMVFREWT
jgi:hypothetical protein